MTDLIEPDEALREEFRASISKRAVIVRTESAGVHFGYLVEKSDTLAGTQVLLVRGLGGFGNGPVRGPYQKLPHSVWISRNPKWRSRLPV